MSQSEWRWDYETTDSFAHGIIKLRPESGEVVDRPDLEGIASHLRATEPVEKAEFDDGILYIWPPYFRAPARAALQHPLASSASQALEIGFAVPVTRGVPLVLAILVAMPLAPIVLGMICAVVPVLPVALGFFSGILIALPGFWFAWKYLIKEPIESWKDELAEAILAGIRSGAIEIDRVEGASVEDGETGRETVRSDHRGDSARSEIDAPNLLPEVLDVDPVSAKGDVVAHAANGRFFATDAGDQLRIWTSEGEKGHELQKMKTEHPESVRYALGPEGRLLLEADEAQVRLVDLEAGAVRWRNEPEERMVFWGAPRFAPDGEQIAAPMTRSGDRSPDVWMIDADTGQYTGRVERGAEFPTMPADAGGIPRNIVFAPDGSRMAIEYGANAPGPTNHSTFLADTETLEIDGCMRPQPGRGVAVDFGRSMAIATIAGDDMLRIFEGRDALTGRPPLNAYGEDNNSDAVARNLQASSGVALDSTGTRVVAVSGGALLQLDLDESTFVELDEVSDRSIEWLGLVDDETRAALLTGDGAIEIVELDPPGEPERSLEWSILAFEHSEAEEAVWEFAKQNFEAAIRRAEPCVTEVDSLYALYILSFLLADRGTLQDLQVDFDRFFSGLVRLAEILVGGGEFVSAVAVVKQWVDSPMREDRPEPERERLASLGVEIVRELRDRNAVQVAQILRRAFPDDYALLEAFVMETKIGQPERAMQAVESFLDRNPESLRAWWRKVDLLERAEADNLRDVLGSTEERFSLDSADDWGQLGRRYANLGDRTKALDCYREALEIEPSSQYYRDRVSELEETA